MPLSRAIPTTTDEQHILRRQFFSWQCRMRQIVMRQHQGQPQSGVVPTPIIDGQPSPAIITVIVRTAEESQLSELQHIVRRSYDPGKRLKDCLKVFSECYYQDPDDFEDTICAVFQPNSRYAEQLLGAEELILDFYAYQQQFQLSVHPKLLGTEDRLFQETYWHNLLFNPAISQDCTIVGFRPDWSKSARK